MVDRSTYSLFPGVYTLLSGVTWPNAPTTATLSGDFSVTAVAWPRNSMFRLQHGHSSGAFIFPVVSPVDNVIAFRSDWFWDNDVGK